MSEYKILPSSGFGPHLSFDTDIGQDLIIVCVQKHQAVPVKVLLPGQLYQVDAIDLMDLHGANELLVMPASSANWITIKREEIEVKSKLPQTAPAEGGEPRV